MCGELLLGVDHSWLMITVPLAVFAYDGIKLADPPENYILGR